MKKIVTAIKRIIREIAAESEAQNNIESLVAEIA